MFTGIIKKIGVVAETKKSGRNRIVKIKSGLGSRKRENSLSRTIGGSIAINGVCATIIKRSASEFETEIMPETLKKTNLAYLRRGDKVNLEPPLKIGDELNGHIVLGHVDGTGIVKSVSGDKKCKIIKIEPPAFLRGYIASKGSIAVNGVSLAISKVGRGNFEISLIPYTLANTNLSDLKPNDKINIEIDVFARYIQKLKQHGEI